MITDEFRVEVQALRDQGLSWPQVSKRVHRPQRTCQRALEMPLRICGRPGCDELATPNGRLCPTHAKLKMRNKPGSGPSQEKVMRVMRKLGHASSEELRALTGLDSSNLGQITGRLVQLGMLDRPIRGHFTMPRPAELTPEHPVPYIRERY